MNYYRDSQGNRYSSVQVDRKIREAKKQRLQIQIDEIGYNRCEECKQNDCLPIDCSHDKSVKWCKENGCVELAWDTSNITPTGRNCHRKKDTNTIMSGKNEK